MKLFLDGPALQSRDSSHAVFLFIYLFPSQYITRVLSAVQISHTYQQANPVQKLLNFQIKHNFSDYFLYGLEIAKYNCNEYEQCPFQFFGLSACLGKEKRKKKVHSSLYQEQRNTGVHPRNSRVPSITSSSKSFSENNFFFFSEHLNTRTPEPMFPAHK